MPATAFPKNWHVEGGLLGVDVDSSTTSLSGGLSVLLPSTASSNASVYSDWYALPDTSLAGSATSSTKRYSIAATVLASTNGAGDDIRIQVELASKDKTTITAFPIYSGALTAPNTWETFGTTETFTGSNEAWVRIRIDRPSNLSFNAYIDNVELKQLPAGASLRDTVGAGFLGAWTNVVFNLPVNSGFSSYDAVGNRLLVYAPGRYVVQATVVLEDSFSDGDMFGARIAIGIPAGATRFWYGSATFPAAYNAATNAIGISVSAAFDADSANIPVPVNFNTVELQVIQYNGTAKDYASATMTVSRVTDR